MPDDLCPTCGAGHQPHTKHHDPIDESGPDSYVQAIPANGVPLAQGPYGARASAAFVVLMGPLMRVCVYVDGFNLYYRALKSSRHKWLNLVKLSKRLLDPADAIEMVRYFTARVSPRAGDPDAPNRPGGVSVRESGCSRRRLQDP
jgi:hypothetical protein